MTEEEARSALLTILQSIVTRNWPRKIYLGSARICSRQDCVTPKVVKQSRLKIFLAGEQVHAISRQGERFDLLCKPGDILFLPPHAWTDPTYDRYFMFFGLVFWPDYLRCLHVGVLGPGKQTDSSIVYHTQKPLGGSGMHLLRALWELSESETESSIGAEMMRPLLRLAIQHLQADAETRIGKAAFTWQRVLNYLHQYYAQPITRATVARELDLHPNYLSMLCRKINGSSFHDVLEAIRIEHAKSLLLNSDLAMDGIARMTGYSCGDYFIKAFKRVQGDTPGTFRCNISK